MPIPILRGDGGGSMKFAEVLEIKNGKNQKQVEDADGKYPIYGSGGIMGWATDYICPAETVIIGRKGTINNPIYVDTPFWNVDTAFGLVADKNILLPKYLYYFCKHFDFLALNTTVTIPSLTKANLLKIDIPIPNMDEQRYIIGVLDDVENLIEIKTKEKSELDNLVKSRFIEMYMNEQNVVRLDALIVPYRAERCGNKTYPVLSITMHNGLVLQSERFKKEIASSDKSQYKVVPRNKLVVAFPIDEGLLSAQTIVDVGIVSPAYNLYDIDENKIFPCVLEYILRSDMSIQYYKSKLRGTTLRRRMIPKSDFDSMPIRLPPIKRQSQFLNEVKEVDKLKFDGIKIINLCEILKIKSWRRES